jgi:hypothetical protein
VSSASSCPSSGPSASCRSSASLLLAGYPLEFAEQSGQPSLRLETCAERARALLGGLHLGSETRQLVGEFTSACFVHGDRGSSRRLAEHRLFCHAQGRPGQPGHHAVRGDAGHDAERQFDLGEVGGRIRQS